MLLGADESVVKLFTRYTLQGFRCVLFKLYGPLDFSMTCYVLLNMLQTHLLFGVIFVGFVENSWYFRYK